MYMCVCAWCEDAYVYVCLRIQYGCGHVSICMYMGVHTHVQYLWSSGIQEGAASLGTSDWTPAGFGPAPGKRTGKGRPSPKLRGAWLWGRGPWVITEQQHQQQRNYVHSGAQAQPLRLFSPLCRGNVLECLPLLGKAIRTELYSPFS